MGYSKLFSEIVMSTIWREPDKVRIVWITMLAIKDRWHIVNASLPGLSDAARVSMKDCEEALKILASKDKYSRSKEYEGRRIEECDGGWLILNGEKYRKKMSLDERREYNRLKQRQYRRESKANPVESCVQSATMSAHTDTDTEAVQDNSCFDVLWQSYPNKDGRKQALKHFAASVKSKNDLKRIFLAQKNYLAHLALPENSWKKPKSGSTWFNNWQDWEVWQEPKKEKGFVW